MIMNMMNIIPPASHRTICLTLLLLILLAMMTACALPQDAASVSQPAMPMVTAEAFGEGNVINAQMENQLLSVDIVSSSGIGRASISSPTGPRPESIRLHLHVRGLEQLEITVGTTTLAAQVSSIDNSIIQTLATAKNAAQTLTSDDPMWLTIQHRMDGESLFSVDIPPALLGESNRLVEVKWIDYYR